MNIPGYSTSGLLMLHNAIHQALAVDDNIKISIDKPYGVREYRDWRKMSDEIEAELSKRGVKFQVVPW